MEVRLYNQIGNGYNLTRKADPYISKRIAYFLFAVPGKRYIDIGCGTGNYTVALAEAGFQFWGLEPSERMLEEAQTKNAVVDWVLGSAESIPFPDAFFDGCIATLTIHHWTSLKKGFIEVFRVLKAHSRFVVFTSTPDQMKGYWLTHYFPKMMAESLSIMPSLSEIEQAATEAGLSIISKEIYNVQPELQDHFLYAGKNNPSLYLEEEIRNGMSSFAILANKAEIDAGLEELKRNLRSGEIECIKEKFESPSGDYLFISFEKDNTG